MIVNGVNEMDKAGFEKLVEELQSPRTSDERIKDLLMMCYDLSTAYIHLMFTEFDRVAPSKDNLVDVANNLETIKFKIENKLEEYKNNGY